MLYLKLKTYRTDEKETDGDVVNEIDLELLDNLQPNDYRVFQAANEALDKRIYRFGTSRHAAMSSKLKDCITVIDNRCRAYGKNSTFSTFGEDWKTICGNFRRDNRDIVELVWKFGLNPPGNSELILQDSLTAIATSTAGCNITGD